MPLLAVLLVGLLSLVVPPAVSAATPDLLMQFGSRGAGAGEIQEVNGVAASPVDGHIFLAEGGFAPTNSARISEYTPWGEFVKAWGWGVADGSDEFQVCIEECQAGIPGTGVGQFRAAAGIEVDSNGDVYVFDRLALRVQKFAPDGTFLLMYGKGVNQGPNNPGNLCTAAFLAGGDTCGAGASGAGPGEFSMENVTGTFGDYLAVGPDDTVYVGDKGKIQRFNPAGAPLGALALPPSGFGGEGANNPGALAVDPVSGDIYFAFNALFVSGPAVQPGVYRLDSTAGTVIDTLDVVFPRALAVDSEGSVYVNVGNYGPEASQGTVQHPLEEVIAFSATGQPTIPLFSEFARPPQVGTVQNISAIGTNTIGDVFVFNDDFQADVAYMAVYGPPPIAFEPPPTVPPQIVSQFAVSVVPTEATLRAQINPRFWSDTRYFVEYGPEPCAVSACTQKPLPPGALLTGKVLNAPVTSGSVFLSGLVPETTYSYRFVAVSGGGGPVLGPERTFTTPPVTPAQPPCPANQSFRLGAAARLPDCRAYEMVSPVDKQGADIEVVFTISGAPASFIQSAESGDRFTFSAYRAFADPESGPYSTQYLSTRNPALGWGTESISPPRNGPSLSPFDGLDVLFKVFSSDLCEGWLLQDTAHSLAPGSVPGFMNLYRRDNCAGGVYSAMTTTEPEGIEAEEFVPEVQGVSADGDQVFFRARGGLAAGGVKGKSQLYEAGPGGLDLVCVRPNGSASNGDCSAGTPGHHDHRSSSVDNAVSDDGAIIYWTESKDGPGRLFARIDGTDTVSVTTDPVTFLAAAADGSKAFYREGEKLWLFDLATEASTEIAAGFKGLLGTSEDASKMYFVSSNDLDEGAVAGQPNLYLWEQGSGTTFIAMLALLDINGVLSPVSALPRYHASQVSSDGSAAAFMSSASPGLTGFDNTDVNSGKPDAEVYLYDAEAEGGEGLLRCVSCLATGARPSGRNIAVEADIRIEPEFWAAAQLPTAESQLYAPRILSADGSRLFFESFDALVIEDTNSRKDVYQWEEAGAGNCQAGVPGFVEQLDGCVSLISSGESSESSEFVDASASGDDVFFKTSASLVTQDPGLIDVYDARVNGGFAPPPPPTPECEGETCQPPAVPPNDPSPSSESVVSPPAPPGGNGKRCPKGKHKVKRKGKVVCVKNKGRSAKERARARAQRGSER